MGNNRYNKVPDYTPREERKKVEEVKLDFKPCCICNGEVTVGYHGVWQEGGTCCGKCEAIRQDMQLYLRDVP